MGEGIFKKINDITGKLPLAGNTATRLFIRDEVFKEPDFEKRVKKIPGALGFTALMVVFHALQAQSGAEKVEELTEKVVQEYQAQGSIDTRDLSREAALAFAFIYALVNVMVTVSQMYIGFRVVKDTGRLKEKKKEEFFSEIGIPSSNGDAYDLRLLSEYVISAARGDKQKQDVLRLAVGRKTIDALVDASEHSKEWEDQTISEEEFRHIIDMLYKNQCPVFDTYPPMKAKRLTLRTVVEFLVTGAGQATFAMI